MREQPGLRKRMELEARRISSQHRQLDAFFAAVVRAARSGVPADAQGAFLRFRDALYAHFSLEERTEFPALRGLRPDLGVELDALVAAHAAFQGELERLRLSLAASDGEAFRRLDALGARLAAHEETEERLFEQSTRRPGPDGSTTTDRRPA